MKTIFTILFCLIYNFGFAGSDLSENWRNVDYFINYTFTSINCCDSMNCMATGNLYGDDGPVYKRSTDRGLTWRIVFADSSIFYLDSTGFPHYSYKVHNHSRCMAFPSKNLCIVGMTSGRTMRSTDMGDSWDTIFVGIKKPVTKLIMFDNKFGAAFLDTNIIITSDGALTWSIINLPNFEFKYTMITLQVTSHCKINILAAGGSVGASKYYLFKTSNCGSSWEKYNIDTCITNIYFFNDSIGWGVGGYHFYMQDFPRFGRIYKTTNGGLSWFIQLDLGDTVENNDLFRNISFNDSLNGLVATAKCIYRTTDGGNSWFSHTDKRITGNDVEIGLRYVTYKQNTALVSGISTKIYKYFVRPLSIEENTILQIDNFKIFSNLVTDFLDISLGDKDIIPEQIEIFSVLGEKVLSAQFSPASVPSNNGHTRIDVSSLPQGMYFVKVGSKVNKFVKI